jgi:putative two-component system response regulator
VSNAEADGDLTAGTVASGLATPPIHGSVLIVEDDTTVAFAIARVLRWAQFAVEIVGDGPSALAAVAERHHDLVLLDWNLPKMRGLEVCERLKRNPEKRLIPVVMLTALSDRAHHLAAITAGADDFVAKPFDPQQLSARILSLVRLKQYTDELESAESIIRSLALTVEARDSGTDGHCQRLSRYATTLGTAIGLDADALAALERGGYLHDVGKIGIPDRVLLKPGGLTPDEYAVMQQHTIIGERLCGNLRSLALVRPIVRSHHERLNGSGYPDGLRGDAIPLSAQIVGVVDTFDAITSTRPYRPARSFDEAREELLGAAQAGKLNPDLVMEFLRLVEEGIEGVTRA